MPKVTDYLHHTIRLARHSARAPTKRSSHWPAIEKAHIKASPVCVCCGGTDRLAVHHKVPFHINPALELEPSNLVTLCMGIQKHCHLLIGHGDNFKAFNPLVEKHAAYVSVSIPQGPAAIVAAIRKFGVEALAARQFGP